MKPQDQETQQPVDQFESRASSQQRVRPAVPEGARAPAAAMTQLPLPQIPEPTFANAPVTQQAAIAPAPGSAYYPRAQERRRSPRQTLVAKAVVRSEFNQNTVATGFLSNISMLGVGFHTRRPLQIGEKFQMRLELGPMKWATRLRVVACQPHESGTYDIGAEFIGSDLVDRVQRELAA